VNEPADPIFAWTAPTSRQQVVRFAVGAPDGPRSRTWRLWVQRGKS